MSKLAAYYCFIHNIFLRFLEESNIFLSGTNISLSLHGVELLQYFVMHTASEKNGSTIFTLENNKSDTEELRGTIT